MSYVRNKLAARALRESASRRQPDHRSAELLARVTDCMRQAAELGFAETSFLLAVARIDLLARLNNISDEEMDCFALGLPRSAADN